MSGWREIKLKEVCDRITVGYVGPMAEQYVDSGIPFLRSLNIHPYRINFDDLKFIGEGFHEKIAKSALRTGDVAVVRTGYPGTAAVVPASLGIANCSDLVIVTPGKDLNPQFLAAIFNSTFGQALVGGNLVGAAQQHFNITVAKELKLRIPDRETQDKIGAILSSYDELIENNRRRIGLLERMAEEIYREWFVRMRFPGYEAARSNKGVPHGWRVEPSSDVFNVLSGGTPKTDVPIFWDGDVPFFTPRDAGENAYVLETEKYITEKGLESCNSPLYPKDTIFITARGTVGKLALAHRPMAINQSCYALTPKAGGPVYFYYLAIRNAITYVKGVSKSGVFDNIIVDTFKTVPILMPDEVLVDRFNLLAKPLFDQIAGLQESNLTLCRIRNVLLPRLISGKFSVDALDIQFPPGMLAPEPALSSTA